MLWQVLFIQCKKQVILNKETKRSRGFGFVTFSTEAARDKAIAMAGSVDFVVWR